MRSQSNTTVIAMAVVAANQALAAATQVAGPRWLGAAGLVPTRNAGSVLGFAQGQVVWIAIAVAGVGVILALARLLADRCGTVALGLMAGGAVANTLQRLTVHGVVDYLAVGTGRIGIVFNLADIALIVGAALAARGLGGRPALAQRTSTRAR